jgi:hypothetical protein
MKNSYFFFLKKFVTFFNLTYYYLFKKLKLKQKEEKEEQETQASATQNFSNNGSSLSIRNTKDQISINIINKIKLLAHHQQNQIISTSSTKISRISRTSSTTSSKISQIFKRFSSKISLHTCLSIS